MGRPPCCEEMGLKKGPWTPEEDHILTSYIHRHGHGNWRALPKLAGLMRCGKSCRLRWINYLRPDIKRGNFTKDEEDTIVKLHHLLGNRWSAIAARLPGRTDNEIKNFWHTNLKKRSTDQAPTPPAVTVTTPTSRNTNLQIIVAQQDDDDATITNTTYNNYYHQTQRELPQSCDDQTVRASNKQQQFDKLLVELEQHKHIDDDENHMDFWYTLFVKSDPHDNNDHHLPSSTHITQH